MGEGWLVAALVRRSGPTCSPSRRRRGDRARQHAGARAPLDLQVTFDTVSVQLERLITSHREMMASLQTVQAEQAVLKREMESRR